MSHFDLRSPILGAVFLATCLFAGNLLPGLLARVFDQPCPELRGRQILGL